MKPIREQLDDRHEWLRVADPQWSDPLDTGYSYRHGGRWNSPNTRHTLYLCADTQTARAQIPRLLRGRFADPEDIRDDFVVVIPVLLPDDQEVADIHTAPGITAVDLPATYPVNADGNLIPHSTCQPIGETVADQELTGVHARSATATPATEATELAWFRPQGEQARPSGEPRPYGLWR